MEAPFPDSARLAVMTVALMVAVVAVVVPASAGDRGMAHSHRGVLPPYETMPVIPLDEKQLARLGKGKLVTMTVVDASGNGRGVAVIDIAAPCDVVWSRILGFEHYAEWVGPVKLVEVYAHEGDTIRTRTKISGFLYRFEYFLVNTYRPDEDLLTWTLDYDHFSDFDDNVGAWSVKPHPQKDGWSRAWFSTDLKLRNPPPAFLMKWIKKQGLKDATKWVKRESERAMGVEPPPRSDPAASGEWE